MAHEEDNIDTSMVAIVGVISSGISFVLIILLMVLYHSFDNAQEQAVTDAPFAEAEQLWTEQEAVLNESAWVDQQTGQIRIPVSTAMDLVVAQLNKTPDDAGVSPPQFAEADGTIMDPSAVEEEAPADNTGGASKDGEAEVTPDAGADTSAGEPAEPKSENPTSDDGSTEEKAADSAE